MNCLGCEMKASIILVTGQNFKGLVDQLSINYGSGYRFNSGCLHVYISEEYYFRIGSNLTTTLIVNETDSNCTIEFISSGGGDGMAGTTWGAEGKSLKVFFEFLKNFCQKSSLTYQVIN
jgi:hypothetical protein